MTFGHGGPAAAADASGAAEAEELGDDAGAGSVRLVVGGPIAEDGLLEQPPRAASPRRMRPKARFNTAT